MTDDEFARLARRCSGWAAAVGTALVAIFAALFATGLFDLKPGTGTAMGILAALAVASTGCWAHWRGKANASNGGTS